MVFFLVGKQILISSECCEMFLFRIPQSIGEREKGGRGEERKEREREKGYFLDISSSRFIPQLCLLAIQVPCDMHKHILHYWVYPLTTSRSNG